MAATKTSAEKSTVAKTPETLIPIFLPLLDDEFGVGEVDQRVTVTINGENKILPRGEHIEVTLTEYNAIIESGRFGKI